MYYSNVLQTLLFFVQVIVVLQRKLKCLYSQIIQQYHNFIEYFVIEISHIHQPCDCLDVLNIQSKRISGVYTVYPLLSQSFEVYCDMETDGGGWTVSIIAITSPYLTILTTKVSMCICIYVYMYLCIYVSMYLAFGLTGFVSSGYIKCVPALRM